MKILLIDDDEGILNLIKMNLLIEGFEVITAINAKEGIRKFEMECPDLVILDVMLPDIEGFEVIKMLQQINNETLVILLTAKEKLNDRLLGLQLGAEDYITKPFDNRELVLRIRTIWRRVNRAKLIKNEQNDAVIESHFIKILIDERKAYIDGMEIQLTSREFKTLSLMVKNSNKVFTRQQLLERLWGFDFIGNSRAVDIHIERLRKKLINHEKAIKTVYGVGYKFEV